MVCCKSRRMLLLLGLVVLLASGCASTGKKTAVDASMETSDIDVALLELIPNPYLARQAKVPPATETAFRNALIAMQSEDWQTAEHQLRGLHQQHPELSGPLVNLAIVYWQQQKLDEADKYFQQALTVNPLNNDAYIQYGFFLREQGRFEDAQSNYLKALEVWPHNAAAHRNLGIVYDLYMGKFDDAMKHYEMVLRLSAESNKEVEGWIIDLKRRQAAG
jgi:Tfp pilus assembly protein PilF